MPKKTKAQVDKTLDFKKKNNHGTISKRKASSKAKHSNRKFRVLHVAGSNVSSFYESLSQLYGLPSFVNAPQEEFDHVVAKVFQDSATQETKW